MKIHELIGIPLSEDYQIFRAGVECEIEGIRNIGVVNQNLFAVTTDGSLRSKHGPSGHGYELQSFPLPAQELKGAFRDLHASLKFHADEQPFSSRTSTHIHVNCLPFTMEQAKNMVMLYALFEELFFAMVKPERRANIHCVPLTDTFLPSRYNLGFEQLHRIWHKYTALNLTRIRDLGTIEFRHLHGTGDSMEFNQWLDTIHNLWDLAQSARVTPGTLSDRSCILSWFDTIFKDAPKIRMLQPQLFNIIQNGLIDVKFSVI